MSAVFFAQLKDLASRVVLLEADNKWLKDALTKVLAQESVYQSRPGKQESAARWSDDMAKSATKKAS